MRFIPDASVSLCWFLPAQATPSSTALLVRAEYSGITVPAHWHLEVINKIGLRLRIGKLTPETLSRDIVLLAALKIDIKPIPTDPVDLLTLMDRYRLTAYDAAYLQLAIATGLPLATYDKDLIAAAPLAKVTLLH